MESDRAIKTVITTSPEETRALGRAIGRALQGGDVVLLSGALGAGKTQLVAGIAEGLRVRNPVSSPTFTLLHTHPPGSGGSLVLHHMDVYRLSDAEDFLRLGFFDLIADDSVLVIEWGDRVRDVLPSDAVEIVLQPVSDDEADDSRRRVALSAPPEKAGRFAKAFEALEEMSLRNPGQRDS